MAKSIKNWSPKLRIKTLGLINLKFKSVVDILLSLSNASIKIIITVFLQLVIVLSFQNGLNSTSGQKILQVTTNKASSLTESNSEATSENNSNGVQILKNSSFIDSGTLHVIGEVINNRPSTAVFVTIVGTFYDVNNKVIGIQFTYTNPTDIGPGKKAPFEIIFASATIPISLIDHYELQVNYE